MQNKYYDYLALGDSYTIGEQVPFLDNFPCQTIQLLRRNGIVFNGPEIIAKTGWTTGELKAAMDNHVFKEQYDFVTLLIGVNNQYRGYPIESYSPDFEVLLNRALKFTANDEKRVMVLSIPDWSVTPFANGKNKEQIANEINHYNAVNKKIAEKKDVYYLNITEWSREAESDPSLLADDGLHPSGKEYKRWAEYLYSIIKDELNNNN